MDDRILETVIFAMENQGAVSYIDLDTGLLSSRVDVSAVSEDPGGEDPDREPIPVWTSQDGFRLMEQFAQTIGHPLVRADLLAALSRGRGVFRAFKDALDTHPEAERKWYEYKSRAMKARIVDWYEELREVRGLAKLGLEPEDTDDLLLSDFRILRHGPEAWKEFADLVREGREDALSRFPPALVEHEFALLDRELSGASAGEYYILSAECEPDSAAGIALVRTLATASGSFARLVFLYVDPERRRLGLGRALAARAREEAARERIRHFVLDLPFLWPEFGASLESLGYSPYGTRWLAVSDA